MTCTATLEVITKDWMGLLTLIPAYTIMCLAIWGFIKYRRRRAEDAIMTRVIEEVISILEYLPILTKGAYILKNLTPIGRNRIEAVKELDTAYWILKESLVISKHLLSVKIWHKLEETLEIIEHLLSITSINSQKFGVSEDGILENIPLLDEERTEGGHGYNSIKELIKEIECTIHKQYDLRK